MKKSRWQLETMPKWENLNITSITHITRLGTPLFVASQASSEGTSHVFWWLPTNRQDWSASWLTSSPLSYTAQRKGKMKWISNLQQLTGYKGHAKRNLNPHNCLLTNDLRLWNVNVRHSSSQHGKETITISKCQEQSRRVTRTFWLCNWGRNQSAYLGLENLVK